MRIQLHKQKTKITSLSKGIDFVGFRNFYYFRLLRKRNIINMKRKLELFSNGQISEEKTGAVFQGWNAYAEWADSINLRLKIASEFAKQPDNRNI